MYQVSKAVIDCLVRFVVHLFFEETNPDINQCFTEAKNRLGIRTTPPVSCQYLCRKLSNDTHPYAFSQRKANQRA